jgi:hypothetical protein
MCYNSLHGLFTSVDPLTASVTIRNPQTFNRYSYALNSPYKFTDPLGLIPSTTCACGQWCSNNLGMNGEPMSVDGSAISGRDSSFDWAREWFGIVVGYALNLPDGSVYEENIITGISRRTRQPANLPHHSTVMVEVTANPSDLYYPFVIRDAGAFFQLVEAGTLGYTDAEGVYQCALLPLDW